MLWKIPMLANDTPFSPHAYADPRQMVYEKARRAFQAMHGREIRRMGGGVRGG